MTDTQAAKPIPVTVLTGYLGSGKTTLLNRILSENHGKQYAVIVNEFGEIGIDNDLIVESDEEIYEMNNGCVCCTVRGDLIRVVEGLMRRPRFDGIIVETTGLADPVPVAQTFFMDDDVRAKTALDAVIALVDAKHLPLRLKDSREAEDQIAFADIVLLNKTDLVSADELADVEGLVRAINPAARIFKTERSGIELERILNQNAFDLKHVLEDDPHFLDHDHDDHVCGPDCDHDHHDHDHHDHHHHHHGLSDHHDVTVQSVSLRGGALDPNRFFPWIQSVTQNQGPNILRLKGILAFNNDDERYVVQGVHMIIEGDHQRPWKDGEARESRLVFIGRDLDREKLEKSFRACEVRS
ncbi:GTP-binding protein [Martelella lutilitoris]|uniref:GTP-binding protein n=1 Tax=Martelella lutilitoris TaxID=2583532 RepID=A0A5C4JQ95_9HYPH|nr:GTP-binding protein [Martelella lutilitoris]TNB47508.1 GTP-binding protein [Martelella lutilitoris]